MAFTIAIPVVENKILFGFNVPALISLGLAGLRHSKQYSSNYTYLPQESWVQTI